MKRLVSSSTRMPAAVGLWGTVFLSACGSTVCGGHDADDSPEAPRIVDMQMKQDPAAGDPWEVVFVADFTDGTGDLSSGRAEFFVGSRSDGTAVKLFDAFRQSGVSLDATAGQLAIPLRFNESVPDGSRVRLSTQFVDGAGRRSNCFSLMLRFDVADAP